MNPYNHPTRQVQVLPTFTHRETKGRQGSTTRQETPGKHFQNGCSVTALSRGGVLQSQGFWAPFCSAGDIAPQGRASPRNTLHDGIWFWFFSLHFRTDFLHSLSPFSWAFALWGLTHLGISSVSIALLIFLLAEPFPSQSLYSFLFHLASLHRSVHRIIQCTCYVICLCLCLSLICPSINLSIIHLVSPTKM